MNLMGEKKKRALVVDDVQINRRLAMAFLTKLGWEVAEVEGGSAVLGWLSNNPPVDLILLDIRMPDLCGEDVCRQLRADPTFAALPIIAYTAHAMPADVERFLANGFNNVLIKPVSLQGLKDVIAAQFP